MFVPIILPVSVVVQRSIPVHGITHLGLRYHPTGTTIHEVSTTTLLFTRSDRLVCSPCQSDPLVLATLLRQQWQDLSFLMSGIPIMPFQADFTIFTDASTQDWGTHMGDSQILVVWTHSDRKLHNNVLELKAVILALQHWVSVLQGHQVMIATDNTTVVAYQQTGRTHSHTLLRLVVNLFLWLQDHNIAIRARQFRAASM